MTNDQIERMKYLMERIQSEGLTTSDRKKLATIYEIVLVVPSFFPRPPLTFKRGYASKLRKEVCSYCPSKIKPNEMKRHVKLIKSQLQKYANQLKAIIENTKPVQPVAPRSVHDLDSTI